MSRRGMVILAVLAASALVPAGAQPRSPTPQDDDFSYLQLGLLTEGVTGTLYDKALARHMTVADRDALLDLKFSDMRADGSLHAAMGGEAPQDGDFEFVLPRGSLQDRKTTLALAYKLERLSTAVFLAGVEDGTDPATRRLLGTLAAQGAQHLALLATLRDRPVLTKLPAPMGPERAGAILDPFLVVPDEPDIPEDQTEGTTP